MSSIKHQNVQLILFLILTMILSGCNEDKSLNSSVEIAPFETSTLQPSVSNDINADNFSIKSYEYAEEDTNSLWDEKNATKVVFNGNTAQISGPDAIFSIGTLTIKQAGTYVLTGTLVNGRILIDADNNDVVRLVLNGISLHHDQGPAIYAPKSAKVVLILEEETKNTISDGSSYTVSEDENEPNAAIFVQNDLSITGNGTLTVSGNYKHGIRAQDILAITGGVININSIGDALRGRDGIAIQNGNFTLDAGGDGIQSNNDINPEKGFVIISGGTFIMQTKNDGIQAESSLNITGGNFQITTGGGSSNAPMRVEDFRRGFDDNRNSTYEAEEESVSMKALKSGKLLSIMGGEFTIDAEDDALHSNGNLTITSGKLSIQTGDDGFHADAKLEISGGEINILKSYEGIEGLSVTISGGSTSIVANDDAINAAGGVDSDSQNGGPMGRDRFAANGDIFVKVSGGTLDLFALRDGIDANGNIFFEGGTAKISALSLGMEGAIDLDGTMLVSGGELITAGSVLNASTDSKQPVILVSYTTEQISDSVIAIKDAKGDTILEYKSRNSYSMSGFTSSSFELGETYSLFVDGKKRTDIKLENIITSLADDGGVYTGSRRRSR